MIKLQNLTRRLLELQGPHAAVCKALGRCLCHRGGGWPVLRFLPFGNQGRPSSCPRRGSRPRTSRPPFGAARSR
jgi:hypothetical protein